MCLLSFCAKITSSILKSCEISEASVRHKPTEHRSDIRGGLSSSPAQWGQLGPQTALAQRQWGRATKTWAEWRHNGVMAFCHKWIWLKSSIQQTINKTWHDLFLFSFIYNLKSILFSLSLYFTVRNQYESTLCSNIYCLKSIHILEFTDSSNLQISVMYMNVN